MQAVGTTTNMYIHTRTFAKQPTLAQTKYIYFSPPYGPNASSNQTKEIKDLNSSQLAHLFNLKVTSVS